MSEWQHSQNYMKYKDERGFLRVKLFLRNVRTGAIEEHDMKKGVEVGDNFQWLTNDGMLEHNLVLEGVGSC